MEEGCLVDGAGAGEADAPLLALALEAEDVELAARPDGLEGVVVGLRGGGGGTASGEDALGVGLLVAALLLGLLRRAAGGPLPRHGRVGAKRRGEGWRAATKSYRLETEPVRVWADIVFFFMYGPNL